MKQFLLKAIFLISIYYLSVSCEETYIVSKSQKILFQVEYVNNIEVYEHWGYFIDVNGNIYSYNLPEKWNFPGEDQTLSEKEAMENLAASKLTDTKIQKAELQKYVNYIDNIAASKVTMSKSKSTLEGTLSYYCYQYSENSSSYKRTIIKTKGHSKCENLNFYSKKVVLWMNEIGTYVPK
jgi:hypothetical protein